MTGELLGPFKNAPRCCRSWDTPLVEVFGGEPRGGAGGAGVVAMPGVAGLGPRCASCINGLSDKRGTVAAASSACVLPVDLSFGRPSGLLLTTLPPLSTLLPSAMPSAAGEATASDDGGGVVEAIGCPWTPVAMSTGTGTAALALAMILALVPVVGPDPDPPRAAVKRRDMMPGSTESASVASAVAASMADGSLAPTASTSSSALAASNAAAAAAAALDATAACAISASAIVCIGCIGCIGCIECYVCHGNCSVGEFCCGIMGLQII